jgi:aspartyl-tRNA(Asn)/glutamyl-tRNA(Gln) amidotransferase subunit A
MAATTEFAAGSPFNPRHGVAPNPWDETRWTGGSSTGSGGALAARLVPLALGTDTGGSIRVPSAWCGITGLKPTRGLLPLDGVASLSWTLDHAGPMARSAADLVVAMAVMAGPAPDDYRGQSVALPLEQSDSKPLRIGVPSGWFDEVCDASVLVAWRAALKTMADAGCTLVPFDSAEWLGDLSQAHRAGWDVLLTELAATQRHNAPQRDRQDKGLQLRIAQGEQVSGLAYAEGLSMRSVMLARFLGLMDGLGLDVLMTPGLGGEAGDLATLTVEVNGARLPFQDVIPRNTMMFNLTGLPALMLPSGLGPNGLPLAVQIVGRPFGDATCLAAGMLFQSRTAFHRLTPPRFASKEP